ncbi:L-lactate permease [candidate division KSB1 bacterium]
MDLLARQGVSMESFLYDTGLYAAMVHAIVGTFIPLIIVCMLTRFFGENRSLREGLQVWRFALFAGLAFTIPYFTVALLLGPEFPTISGSLIGLLIVVNGAKRGWFLPREGVPWDFPHRSKWEPGWVGTINQTEEPLPENVSLFKAWSAYILICFLLVITRLDSLGLKKVLTSDALTIRFVNILGVEGITESISLLYLAGTIFMLATIMTVVIYRMKPRRVGVACRDAVSRLFKPFITLIFAVALVRVFIDSDVNAAGLPSMPLQLAEMIAAVTGSLWPMFAAGLGSFGSFIAGSNTVSNLMFALFQFGVAENIGVSHAVVLGLQAVGGAAGNMITIHNIVAACATVGLVGIEGAIIRKTIIPMIYYIVFAGILGMILCSLVPGGF